MPELPEVETIARMLAGIHEGAAFSIIDCKIQDALVLWERTLANQLPNDFTARVKNQSVRSVWRRGKFLVFTLSKDTILIHLRMSGDLRLESVFDEAGVEIPLQKHDRLVLIFTSGTRLAFNNPRKFGRVWLVSDPNEILANLGPEPLDNALDADCFYHMLHAHKRQLKPLLMDQHFIAGMGNIYTDETLYRAKLHPLRRSNTITKKESACLLDSIRFVIQEGIYHNGASIDWAYRGGDFQNHFNVYGRTGELCSVCGTQIERLLVGQRSTHICPHCQRV
ncbi:MAG: bifunctional DNA-formamidopyrimidine glycosylase/DNA-(apurinic or apyrimidinic site) lyase [Anaerolineaceae bacterium]|nr:bifunctional DNA-formamidopyrimidine glycosylase/DNA-(apurinic or apyrimidinic site) lyase [Anaerolineaceae bacterium]